MFFVLKKKYEELRLDFLTLKNPIYKKSGKHLDKIKKLKKFGYYDLGKIISDKNIHKANDLIDQKIKNKEASFINKQNIWKISFLDDFEFILEDILTLSTYEFLCDYFQRNIFLSDIDIRKVMPSKYEDILNNGKSNSDWHKDTRGRQIKIMVYLSDVTIKDSYFSLIPSTHKKRTYDFEESRLAETKIDKKNIKNWLGSKGQAMLFDTNITHRLNRQETALERYSITLYFTPGQSLRKISKKNLNLNNIDKKISKIFSNSLFEARI